MASLPGDYTSEASCPGHDYPGALMAGDFGGSAMKWGWNRMEPESEKPSIGQVYAIHFWLLMGMIKIT